MVQYKQQFLASGITLALTCIAANSYWLQYRSGPQPPNKPLLPLRPLRVSALSPAAVAQTCITANSVNLGVIGTPTLHGPVASHPYFPCQMPIYLKTFLFIQENEKFRWLYFPQNYIFGSKFLFKFENIFLFIQVVGHYDHNTHSKLLRT